MSMDSGNTPPPPPPPPGSAPDPNAALRKQAESRLRSKMNFYRYLGVWAAVSIFMVVIWALSGRGYFWPIWPIVGMGFAAIWIGLAAFGPRSGGPSESEIRAEMKKME